MQPAGAAVLRDMLQTVGREGAAQGLGEPLAAAAQGLHAAVQQRAAACTTISQPLPRIQLVQWPQAPCLWQAASSPVVLWVVPGSS